MSNYIKVDEDGDTVTVYDEEDNTFREFAPPLTKLQRRAQAVEYAKQEAARLGVEWGENWA